MASRGSTHNGSEQVKPQTRSPAGATDAAPAQKRFWPDFKYSVFVPVTLQLAQGENITQTNAKKENCVNWIKIPCQKEQKKYIGICCGLGPDMK